MKGDFFASPPARPLLAGDSEIWVWIYLLEGFFWEGGGSLRFGGGDERHLWQGVCSRPVSPEMLALVHLHPALNVRRWWGWIFLV